MTRTTNARIAGFTYLFYAAIGICIELLMHQARGGDGGAAKLARIGQYATNVRLTILITLLECLSALVLGVTLYGITRDEDHELAMLGLVCRVAEGVLGSLNNIPGYLGLLWLAKAGGRDGCPGHPHNERAARVSADAGPERPPRCDLLCRGEFDLFLSPPARTDGPRLNRMAGRVRVGPARGGTAPAARRFLHRAADRILPVAAGARIPGRARAVAAHQRCRHAGRGTGLEVGSKIKTGGGGGDGAERDRTVTPRCARVTVPSNFSGGGARRPPSPPEVDGSIQSIRGQIRERRQRGGVAFGGAERDRTVDLLNAIQALSQTELQPHAREGGR